MDMYNEFIINRETCGIVPEFAQNGKLCSLVYDGYDSFVIDSSPRKIIDESCKYYLSSLFGAIEGSKAVLGNKHMPPVKISGALNIIWFPCNSPNNKEYIWLALGNIDDYEPYGVNQTKVILKYGHSINVDMKLARFETRYHRAHTLRSKHLERTNMRKTFYLTQNRGFGYVHDPNANNYRVKRKKEENE
jgi:competence protein ComK